MRSVDMQIPENVVFAILFVLVIALVGVIFYLSFFFARKRKAALEAYAAANGWQKFDEARARAILENLPLISGRYMVKALNSYAMAVGQNWYVFCDFSLQRGHGKGREYYLQTGLIVTSTALVVPEFALTYRSMMTALLPKGNGEEAAFPDTPQFAAKYLVKSPAVVATQAFLTPAVRVSLEGCDKLWMVGNGNAVALFEPFKNCKVQALPSYLEKLGGILSQLAGGR